MDNVQAYKIVCGGENPCESYEWMNEIERKGLILPFMPFLGLLPSKYETSACQVVQQAVLRSTRRRVLPALLRHCAGDAAPKVIPLPRQWLSVLENAGVSVNRVQSKTAFFKEQCRAWFRGLVAFQSKMHCALKSYDESASYHMYPDLSEDACVQADNRENFIRWLRDNNEVSTDHKILVTARRAFQSKDVRYCRYIFPRLPILSVFGFVIECLYIFCVAFIRWVCGGWHIPFVVAELISCAYFKRIDNPAKRYAFNNSSYAIRPLWTYLAERAGGDILLYFYSGNTNVLYTGQNKESPPTPGYISMSWPKYWALDEDQEYFLTKQCGVKSNVLVKGALTFTDNGNTIPPSNKPVMALFDIPVYNVDYIANLGIIAPFYTAEIIGQFINDVVETGKKYGYQIFWKTKRDMSDNPHISGYNDILRRYENDQSVTFIDPGVAAKRLIARVDCAISLPYTSAILSAKDMEVNACFYDPTKSLAYFQGLSRGIEVVQGLDALDDFLKALDRIPKTA